MVALHFLPMVAVLPPSALAQLKRNNYAVVPNYATPQLVRDARNDIELLRRQNQFNSAGVGEGKTNRNDNSVRVCEQCFLYPRPPDAAGDAAARHSLYATLDGLRDSLAANGTPLEPLLTEGLYAYYPSGGFYRRHVDAVAGQPSGLRTYSWLLYLNEKWVPGDGGELKIYLEGDAERESDDDAFVTVEPRAGTLVVFRSDKVPHEVLDTSKERAAVVGWFSQPVQGSGVRRQLIGVLAAALVVVGGAKLAGLAPYK